MPLGEGDLNISEYLNLAKQHKCRVLLETKTVDGVRQSVQWLKQNI